jgi:hypothetical protein
VGELVAATGNSKLRNYLADSIQNSEEAYRSAGYSEAQAKWNALFARGLTELMPLTDLGKSLGELAERYRQAGDEASAQATLQMGVTLGHRVSEWQSYALQDLAGLQIEEGILRTVDPASPYDSAGSTVKQRLDEIAQRKEAISDIRRSSPEPILQSLSEQEMIGFLDRIKVSGQENAAQWARNRQGAGRGERDLP